MVPSSVDSNKDDYERELLFWKKVIIVIAMYRITQIHLSKAFLEQCLKLK